MRFLKITLLVVLMSLPASAEIIPGGDGAPADFPGGLTSSTAIDLTFQGDATADCATGNVCSGIYTPTITITGGSCSTPTIGANYIRVGSHVFVSFKFNGSSCTGPLDIDLSLPIASNFAGLNDCQGSFADDCADCAGRILANSSANECHMRSTNATSGTVDLAGTFLYIIK